MARGWPVKKWANSSQGGKEAVGIWDEMPEVAEFSKHNKSTGHSKTQEPNFYRFVILLKKSQGRASWLQIWPGQSIGLLLVDC